MMTRFLLVALLAVVAIAAVTGLPTSTSVERSHRLQAMVEQAPRAASPAQAPPKGKVKDNVELKVSVAESSVADVLHRLKLKPGQAEQRQVTFYDTKDLALSAAGLVLRSRKVKNGADDSTVKLRPLTRTSVPASWFSQEGFKCEVDAVGEKAMESCSLSRTQKTGEIDAVKDGKREIQKLFDSTQEAWAKFGGAKVNWSTVRALGPVPSQVWEYQAPAAANLGSAVVAELWTMPNGTQLLELSVKVPRADWTRARTAFDAYLAGVGVVVASAQETKTKVAMTTFAAKLK